MRQQPGTPIAVFDSRDGDNKHRRPQKRLAQNSRMASSALIPVTLEPPISERHPSPNKCPGPFLVILQLRYGTSALPKKRFIIRPASFPPNALCRCSSERVRRACFRMREPTTRASTRSSEFPGPRSCSFVSTLDLLLTAFELSLCKHPTSPTSFSIEKQLIGLRNLVLYSRACSSSSTLHVMSAECMQLFCHSDCNRAFHGRNVAARSGSCCAVYHSTSAAVHQGWLGPTDTIERALLSHLTLR